MNSHSHQEGLDISEMSLEQAPTFVSARHQATPVNRVGFKQAYS